MARHLKVLKGNQSRRKVIPVPEIKKEEGINDINKNYDPIGSRIIELRQYLLYLEQQIIVKQEPAEEKDEEKTEKRIEIETEKGIEIKTEKGIEKKGPKGVEIPKLMPPPAFPQNYPFSDLFEKKPLNSTIQLVKFSGFMPKKEIDEKRRDCIQRLVEQAGYFDIQDENMVLKFLSGVLDHYLQKFVMILCSNKNSEAFFEDKDLWNAFETTLHTFGIGGISALHVFYYENVVKKHDALERKCNELYNQLKAIKLEVED